MPGIRFEEAQCAPVFCVSYRKPALLATFEGEDNRVFAERVIPAFE